MCVVNQIRSKRFAAMLVLADLALRAMLRRPYPVRDGLKTTSPAPSRQ